VKDIFVAARSAGDDSDDANAGPETDTEPNAVTAGATGRWTPEEDAELISAAAKTKKKWWARSPREIG
jgi:hypothetical protein